MYNSKKMRLPDPWKLASVGDNSAGHGLRICPLLLRTPLENFLRRREKLFSTISYEELAHNLFRVDTSTNITATTSRAAQEIKASFALAEIAGSFAVVAATLDSKTYSHSVLRLERSAFPIAIRPYLGTEAVAEVIERFISDGKLRLEVLHFRASSPRGNPKMQMHGAMTLADVKQKARGEGLRLEGIRLRALDQDGVEMFRLRADSRCRLLIEKWQFEGNPLEITRSLIDAYRTTIEARDETETVSEESAARVVTIPFPASDEQSLDYLIRVLRRQVGLYVFPLGPDTSEPIRIIDFVSGVSCQLSVHSDGYLNLASNGQITDAFMERLRTIISEIKSSAVSKSEG